MRKDNTKVYTEIYTTQYATAIAQAMHVCQLTLSQTYYRPDLITKLSVHEGIPLLSKMINILPPSHNIHFIQIQHL